MRLFDARSDRRKNPCGVIAKKITEIAKTYGGIGIAVEDLKLADDKDVKRKFTKIKHQFIYRKLLASLESSCNHAGVEITKIKPQFTSKIGLYKYCHQYGMGVHNGAAMVIARRNYNFKEKVPKDLKERLVEDLDKFNNKNEWSKWNKISKSIRRKVVENGWATHLVKEINNS